MCEDEKWHTYSQQRVEIFDVRMFGYFNKQVSGEIYEGRRNHIGI
jgi:hypothetical protein